jgi:hypothetical protein
MKLWLVGRYREQSPTEILGIYDSEAGARQRCSGRADFYQVYGLNEDEPEELYVDKDTVYPNAAMADEG